LLQTIPGVGKEGAIGSVSKKTTLCFDYQQYVVNNFLEPCGGLTVISELKCLNLDY